MTALGDFSADLERLVATAAPAVVRVEAGRGQGSGIVVAQDGFVVTNAHVAQGAARSHVHVFDGDGVPARLLGEDPATDLAVLKSDTSFPASLAVAEARARVGQVVLAIGNPLRFEGSVSLGVVSALERQLAGRDHVLEGLIQTDAAINPGNSGGPLVDVHGAVVGINTAMLAFAQGIGFAIPAHTVSWVTAALIQRGHIDRPRLGIAARGEPLSPRLAASLGQQRAVRIHRVEPGSPAADAGLRRGDLVLSIDGFSTGAIDDVHRILVLSQAREVTLELFRDEQRLRRTVRPRLRRAA